MWAVIILGKKKNEKQLSHHCKRLKCIILYRYKVK